MRILVIEDDVALNGILAKRLAEEGHSVDCCFDGRMENIVEAKSLCKSFGGKLAVDHVNMAVRKGDIYG